MKKILLFFALMILSFAGFSQMKGTYVVPNRTTAFNQPLPAYTLVLQTDSMKYWYLTTGAAATGTLATVSKIRFTPLAQRTIGTYNFWLQNENVGSTKFVGSYLTDGTNNFLNGVGFTTDTLAAMRYTNGTISSAVGAYKTMADMRYEKSTGKKNRLYVTNDSIAFKMNDILTGYFLTNGNLRLLYNLTVSGNTYLGDALSPTADTTFQYCRWKYATGAGAGKLWQSDATGIGSWQTFTGFDSTHCWTDLNIHQITPCSDLTIAGNINTEDTTKGNLFHPSTGATQTFLHRINVTQRTSLNDTLSITANGVTQIYNTIGGGNYFATNYYDNNVLKWQLGKYAGNNFVLYDCVYNKYSFNMTQESDFSRELAANSLGYAMYVTCNQGGLTGYYIDNLSTAAGTTQAFYRARNRINQSMQVGVMGENGSVYGTVYPPNCVYFENEGHGNMNIVNDSLGDINFFTKAAFYQSDSAKAMRIDSARNVYTYYNTELGDGATDTVKVTGKFGLNGTYYSAFTTLPNATGNLANSVTDMDTLFSDRLIVNRIGINTNSPLAKIHSLGTVASGKDLFIYTDGAINKTGGTFALATDTSSFDLTSSTLGALTLNLTGQIGNAKSRFQWSFTPQADPLISYNDITGANLLKLDSVSRFLYGNDAINYPVTQSYFNAIYADATRYALAVIGTQTSSATAGGMLIISSDDGAYLASGHQMGMLFFTSPAGASGAGHSIATGGCSIRAFTTQLWANGSYGNKMVFYTTPNSTATALARLAIEQNGGETWTPVLTGNVVAATGMTSIMVSANVEYNGNSAIDISANPQIVAGVNGQRMTIMGTSDVNTLTLDDANGLQLAGGVTFVIGSGDMITLQYSSTLSVWVEVGRSDN